MAASPQEPQVELEDKQLLEPSHKAIEDAKSGARDGAVPVATAMDARESLQKFVESLHQKAASLTSWISALEAPSNPQPSDRAKKFFI